MPEKQGDEAEPRGRLFPRSDADAVVHSGRRGCDRAFPPDENRFFGGLGHDHRLHRADISVNGWGNIASVNWLEVSCLGNRGKNFGRAKTIMASVNESQQRYGKRAGG